MTKLILTISINTKQIALLNDVVHFRNYNKAVYFINFLSKSKSLIIVDELITDSFIIFYISENCSEIYVTPRYAFICNFNGVGFFRS
ncbi:hypothetical protein RVBP17_3310 [Pseudomonas phage sp. 30-3]|nr:hypothetical protein RVBP17_3310 [Pseudomonas phage sp. 30-3]